MSVIIGWGTESFSFEFGVAIGIQKDFTRADDGSIFSEKHVITVKGSIVASGATPEDRYEDLMDKAQAYAQRVHGGNREATLQMGALSIGGLIVYDNVSLQSINVSEPSEDTAAIHYQDVSLVFETYNTPSDPATAYKLRSASENLEIKKEEDAFSYLEQNVHSELEPYHSYTVTHTINAQGLVDRLKNTEAFEEAYNYVNSRKKDSLGLVNSDVFGRALFSTLEQKTFEVSGKSSIVVNKTQIEQYGEYNKIRTASADVTTGSYSITTTFFLSREPVNIDITGNYSRDDSGEASVTVEGTIQGLSSKDSTDAQHNKISPARVAYADIAGDLRGNSKIYQFASDIYTRYHTDKSCTALRDRPLNTSFGENKNKGTIVFNVSYKVYSGAVVSLLNSISNALTATATIADSNRSGAGYDMDSIVIIPIIGRGSAGPIIQNMNVTKERKRDVSIDVTLDICERKPVNDTLREQALGVINEYKPIANKVYVSEFNETWDWINGKYQGSIGWIYTP